MSSPSETNKARFLEDQRDATLYDWGPVLAKNPNLKEVYLAKDEHGRIVDEPQSGFAIDPAPETIDADPAPKKRGRPPKVFTG